MPAILAELTRHPVKTRLALTGPMIVARDAAHAKLKARLDAGEALPQYIKDHPVDYAGPAKTPQGYASGSFGPPTAGRIDSYFEQLPSDGGPRDLPATGHPPDSGRPACPAPGG